MKMNWNKIRDKKLEKIRKEEDYRKQYISKLDTSRFINKLMILVDDKSPGKHCYGLSDLSSLWEEFRVMLGLFTGSWWEPYWMKDEETKAYVFESILCNLRENEIEHEEVEGFYRVFIKMP